MTHYDAFLKKPEFYTPLKYRDTLAKGRARMNNDGETALWNNWYKKTPKTN